MSVQYVGKDCFLCGTEEKLKELYPQTFRDEDLDPSVFSARRVTEHFHYKMVRCENCGLVFSKDVLHEDCLRDLYGESAFTFGDVTSVLRRDYWRPIAPILEKSSGLSALEIGCSSGFFLEELKDRGFGRVRGCEPSLDAKANAASSIRENIFSSFFEGEKSFPGERFDLVCSFHTLDHIFEPGDFLKDCRRVMRPGGFLYVVTHDVDALQAKVLREKSPIIDIEHIYLFNRKTLRRAIEAVGLETVKIGRLRNSYPLNFWTKMFPMPERLKKAVLSGLSRSGLGNWSPSIHAGNIFAVARLPLAN